MDKLFLSNSKAGVLALFFLVAQGVSAFELLSEGAMGSVSAVSANESWQWPIASLFSVSNRIRIG